jgi:hypothetical protein
MPKQFYRIWFSNGREDTAKLILDTERFPLRTTIGDYSRLFPYSEAAKMKRFFRTGLYDSFAEAFNDDGNITGVKA